MSKEEQIRVLKEKVENSKLMVRLETNSIEFYERQIKILEKIK